ncbi:MAG: T9SS type A sorting domain-containing protein [Candidatus Eisenbacteria bacterium]|nr:T9SS type A sorting domain-containing protein [Candidatus Eisenbacteria bacterium]
MRAVAENSCVRYTGMRLLPLAGMPDRDVIEVGFRTVCPDSVQPCLMQAALVSDSLWLPAQAPGAHKLEVRVVDVACADSVLGVANKLLTYTVLDTCGPPPPPPPSERCAMPFLVPTPSITANADRCNLRLPRGAAGSFYYSAQTQGVRLAGLQGMISAPAGRLRIERLEVAGVARDMNLQTQRQNDGSLRFVMWADRGAPIPAGPPVMVLRVFVRADSGAAPGEVAVSGVVTAASDSAGNGVALCDIQTFAPVVATVCIGLPASGCDVNGDQVTNVADLVRMVRCWFRPAECPDTLAARPDCNGDGAFHLDDVLCCARGILGGRRDSVVHAPGNLRLVFGQPALVGDVLRVPLVMSGGGQLSGALLRVSYPSDRYEAGQWDGAGLPSGADGVIGESNWTVVSEQGSDDILLGLLRLDDAASEDVTMTLQLRLRPGQQHGGSMAVAEGELTATDGGAIDVPLSGVTAQLPENPAAGIASLSLAAARPNPTAGRATFAVGLPAAGVVDLAIYDLAGRRVATLWRGTLAAGEREFTWDGSAARSGVYFARLVVDGEVRTSRVVVRRAR